jgi:hypothetical protein
MKHYKAHWGTLLIITSSLFSLACLGPAVMAFKHGGPSSWVGWLLLTLFGACALFTVRGYTVTADAILVHRLLWTTRLPLAGLQSAQLEPNAMRWSIRTFGNGGFFSFSGFYRNKLLGAYRAFVTDRNQTVVLRYSGHTIVVSPSSPEKFTQELASSHAVF